MKPLKVAAAKILVLNPSEKDYLLAQVSEIVVEYGDRITGSFVMVRLDDGTATPVVHRRRSWRNTGELVGLLFTMATRIITGEFEEV